MNSTELFEYLKALNKQLEPIHKKAVANLYVRYIDGVNDDEVEGIVDNDNSIFDLLKTYLTDVSLIKLIYNAFLTNKDIYFTGREDNTFLAILIEDGNYTVKYSFTIFIEDKT